ncbi:uncharacterized protein LOC132200321 isoform X2 [Neocloeon triangulifer]|uniref:uncharacterized protein LOC132200321 isoform X2 n=1 Tax=Neocloeon triangulifer TaxID=2078957 RepID=UPI00286EBB43|nr:uncharacterized protein LOC132200321 isoform X2 [Neocloeon triangulifer]
MCSRKGWREDAVVVGGGGSFSMEPLMNLPADLFELQLPSPPPFFDAMVNSNSSSSQHENNNTSKCNNNLFTSAEQQQDLTVSVFDLAAAAYCPDAAVLAPPSSATDAGPAGLHSALQPSMYEDKQPSTMQQTSFPQQTDSSSCPTTSFVPALSDTTLPSQQLQQINAAAAAENLELEEGEIVDDSAPSVDTSGLLKLNYVRRSSPPPPPPTITLPLSVNVPPTTTTTTTDQETLSPDDLQFAGLEDFELPPVASMLHHAQVGADEIVNMINANQPKIVIEVAEVAAGEHVPAGPHDALALQLIQGISSHVHKFSQINADSSDKPANPSPEESCHENRNLASSDRIEAKQTDPPIRDKQWQQPDLLTSRAECLLTENARKTAQEIALELSGAALEEYGKSSQLGEGQKNLVKTKAAQKMYDSSSPKSDGTVPLILRSSRPSMVRPPKRVDSKKIITEGRILLKPPTAYEGSTLSGQQTLKIVDMFAPQTPIRRSSPTQTVNSPISEVFSKTSAIEVKVLKNSNESLNISKVVGPSSSRNSRETSKQAKPTNPSSIQAISAQAALEKLEACGVTITSKEKSKLPSPKKKTLIETPGKSGSDVHPDIVELDSVKKTPPFDERPRKCMVVLEKCSSQETVVFGNETQASKIAESSPSKRRTVKRKLEEAPRSPGKEQGKTSASVSVDRNSPPPSPNNSAPPLPKEKSKGKPKESSELSLSKLLATDEQPFEGFDLHDEEIPAPLVQSVQTQPMIQTTTLVQTSPAATAGQVIESNEVGKEKLKSKSNMKKSKELDRISYGTLGASRDGELDQDWSRPVRSCRRRTLEIIRKATGANKRAHEDDSDKDSEEESDEDSSDEDFTMRGSGKQQKNASKMFKSFINTSNYSGSDSSGNLAKSAVSNLKQSKYLPIENQRSPIDDLDMIDNMIEEASKPTAVGTSENTKLKAKGDSNKDISRKILEELPSVADQAILSLLAKKTSGNSSSTSLLNTNTGAFHSLPDMGINKTVIILTEEEVTEVDNEFIGSLINNSCVLAKENPDENPFKCKYILPAALPPDNIVEPPKVSQPDFCETVSEVHINLDDSHKADTDKSESDNNSETIETKSEIEKFSTVEDSNSANMTIWEEPLDTEVKIEPISPKSSAETNSPPSECQEPPANKSKTPFAGKMPALIKTKMLDRQNEVMSEMPITQADQAKQSAELNVMSRKVLPEEQPKELPNSGVTDVQDEVEDQRKRVEARSEEAPTKHAEAATETGTSRDPPKPENINQNYQEQPNKKTEQVKERASSPEDGIECIGNYPPERPLSTPSISSAVSFSRSVDKVNSESDSEDDSDEIIGASSGDDSDLDESASKSNKKKKKNKKGDKEMISILRKYIKALENEMHMHKSQNKKLKLKLTHMKKEMAEKVSTLNCYRAMVDAVVERSLSDPIMVPTIEAMRIPGADGILETSKRRVQIKTCPGDN